MKGQVTFWPIFEVSIFLNDLTPDGDSCDEEVSFLRGDKGGKEFLLGSEKLGERFLEPFPIIGCGIVTGAVSGRIRVCIRLPPCKYVGGDGDGEGENGGES